MDYPDNHSATSSATAAGARRWGQPFWIALAVLLLLQLGIAVVLCMVREGQEFSNDAQDYHQYLRDPHILLADLRTSGMGGAYFASPLLPYLIYVPYHFFSALGIPEEYRLFLGLRLVVISWAALGIILSWRVFQQTWQIRSTLRDHWFSLLLVCLPLTIIAPAVLSQDDSVCLGWAGIGLYCWHRWGVSALLIVVSLGVWFAKPFLLFMFPAIWMSYPQWRTTTVVLCGAVTASLLGFFYWRDGNLTILTYTENGSNAATLYSVGWLLQPNFDLGKWNAHAHLVKSLSTPIFLSTMSIWCLSSWRKPYALPAAVVGTYFVFFSSQTMLMPEYEFWFLPWMLWLMWWCIRHERWSLLAFCWLHSTISYAYKLLYACDGIHFFKMTRSPLENYYSEHFDFDLRWPMSVLAIAATVCRIAIVVCIWKMRDQIKVETAPAQQAQIST